MTEYTCPRCGNGANQAGISLAYLEWRLTPVVGQTRYRVICSYNDSESEGIEEGEKLSCDGIPSDAPDLEHFFCHQCEFRWTDARGHDDTDAADTDTITEG